MISSLFSEFSSLLMAAGTREALVPSADPWTNTLRALNPLVTGNISLSLMPVYQTGSLQLPLP